MRDWAPANHQYKVIAILFFLPLFLSGLSGYGVVPSDNPILIISSYNPETFQTSQNISEFIDEYKRLGGNIPVAIENMNCKSFSEALIWRSKLKDILYKYVGSKRPRAIMLLGQEAWASYISLDDTVNCDVPVFCGMVSRNVVILPSDSLSLVEWKPESIDVQDEMKLQVNGFLYEYDIEKNIRLILDLYPDIENVAFISDNSYGGVTMQAHVKREMKKFPDLNLTLLDGREHTIYTIVDCLRLLPPKSVILVGTWRVDKNDGYFMSNATYSMMSANMKLPAFTLSGTGLGHWVIGGYVPEYRTVGKDLAHQIVASLDGNKVKAGQSLHIIPEGYIFDYQKLKEFQIPSEVLPEKYDLVNPDISFFERYRYQIWAVFIVFGLLLAGFLITLYFYFRMKRLKDELQESEVELVAAKERAEESDRLKSAFLANMSHEIRTPLNAIVGFANVLTSDTYSLEEQKEFMDVIQTNSDLLLRLINDVLDISRLETGKLKLCYETSDIVAICQSTMTTTSFSKKTLVNCVFKPEVEMFEMETDVQRLQQVLINLLSNANKFTVQGEITLAFKIDWQNERVIFSVSDTGCGIPEGKREKVFERFEKLNEYAQGTGLGLAICKITVERLGGRIWVDKEYQPGARFIFTHPIHRPR